MVIDPEMLDAVRRQLEADYPHEGCGLLVGRPGIGGEVVVTDCLPVSNARLGGESANTRYLISPEDFRRADNGAAAGGDEVIGVYHSHPDVGPFPSDYDREHAWPWFHYLIISVTAGSAGEERVWRLLDDRSSFVEQDLNLKELKCL